MLPSPSGVIHALWHGSNCPPATGYPGTWSSLSRSPPCCWARQCECLQPSPSFCACWPSPGGSGIRQDKKILAQPSRSFSVWIPPVSLVSGLLPPLFLWLRCPLVCLGTAEGASLLVKYKPRAVSWRHSPLHALGSSTLQCAALHSVKHSWGEDQCRSSFSSTSHRHYKVLFALPHSVAKSWFQLWATCQRLSCLTEKLS